MEAEFLDTNIIIRHLTQDNPDQASNLDFVDALIISQLERTKIATVISFDQDFDRFKQIQRRGR